MQLESRVFSDARVQKLMKEFVCVKVDPRDPNHDPEAMEYKQSRYVPEVVFLNPDLVVQGTLEGRSVEEAITELETVLKGASGVTR